MVEAQRTPEDALNAAERARQGLMQQVGTITAIPRIQPNPQATGAAIDNANRQAHESVASLVDYAAHLGARLPMNRDQVHVQLEHMIPHDQQERYRPFTDGITELVERVEEAHVAHDSQVEANARRELSSGLQQFQQVLEQARECQITTTRDAFIGAANQCDSYLETVSNPALRREIEATRNSANSLSERLSRNHPEQISEQEFQNLELRIGYVRRSVELSSSLQNPTSRATLEAISARGLEALGSTPSDTQTQKAQAQLFIAEVYASATSDSQRQTFASQSEGLSSGRLSLTQVTQNLTNQLSEQLTRSQSTIHDADAIRISNETRSATPSIDSLEHIRRSILIIREIHTLESERISSETRSGSLTILHRALSAPIDLDAVFQSQLGERYVNADPSLRPSIEAMSARVQNSPSTPELQSERTAFTEILRNRESLSTLIQREPQGSTLAQIYLQTENSANGILADLSAGREVESPRMYAFQLRLSMIFGTRDQIQQSFGVASPTPEESQNLESRVNGVRNISDAIAHLRGPEREAVLQIYSQGMTALSLGRVVEAANCFIFAQAYSQSPTDRAAIRELQSGSVESNTWYSNAYLDRAQATSIADLALRANYLAYSDLSIAAYRRGDLNGAQTLQEFSSLYLRAAISGSTSILTLAQNGIPEQHFPSLNDLRTRLSGDNPPSVAEILGPHGTPQESLQTLTNFRLSLNPLESQVGLDEIDHRTAALHLDSARVRTRYASEARSFHIRAESARRTGDVAGAALFDREAALVDLPRIQARLAQARHNYEQGLELSRQAATIRLQALSESGDVADQHNHQADILARRGVFLMQAGHGQALATMGLNRSITTLNTINRYQGRLSFDHSADSYVEVANRASTATNLASETLLLQQAGSELALGEIALANNQGQQHAENVISRMVARDRARSEQIATVSNGVHDMNVVDGALTLDNSKLAYDPSMVNSEFTRATRMVRHGDTQGAMRVLGRTANYIETRGQRVTVIQNHNSYLQGASTSEQSSGRMVDYDTVEMIRGLDVAEHFALLGRSHYANRWRDRVAELQSVGGRRQQLHNEIVSEQVIVTEATSRAQNSLERLTNPNATESPLYSDLQGTRYGNITHTANAIAVNTAAGYDRVAQDATAQATAATARIHELERAHDSVRTRADVNSENIVPDIVAALEGEGTHESDVRRLQGMDGQHALDYLTQHSDLLIRGTQLLHQFGNLTAPQEGFLAEAQHIAGTQEFARYHDAWRITDVASERAIAILDSADLLRLPGRGSSIDRDVLRQQSRHFVQIANYASTHPSTVADELNRDQTISLPAITLTRASQNLASSAVGRLMEGMTGDIVEEYRVVASAGSDSMTIRSAIREGISGFIHQEQLMAQGSGESVRGRGASAQASDQVSNLVSTATLAQMQLVRTSTNGCRNEDEALTIRNMIQSSDRIEQAYGQMVSGLGQSISATDNATRALDALGGGAKEINLAYAPLETSLHDLSTPGLSAHALSSARSAMNTAVTSAGDRANLDLQLGQERMRLAGYAQTAGTIAVSLVPGLGIPVAAYFLGDSVYNLHEQSMSRGGYDELSRLELGLGWGGIGLAGLGGVTSVTGEFVRVANEAAQLNMIGETAEALGNSRGVMSHLTTIERAEMIGETTENVTLRSVDQINRSALGRFTRYAGYSMIGGGILLGAGSMWQLHQSQDSLATDYGFAIFNMVQPFIHMGFEAVGRRVSAPVSQGPMLANEALYYMYRNTTPENRAAIRAVEAAVTRVSGEYISPHELMGLLAHYSDAQGRPVTFNTNEAASLLYEYHQYARSRETSNQPISDLHTFATTERTGWLQEQRTSFEQTRSQILEGLRGHVIGEGVHEQNYTYGNTERPIAQVESTANSVAAAQHLLETVANPRSLTPDQVEGHLRILGLSANRADEVHALLNDAQFVEATRGTNGTPNHEQQMVRADAIIQAQRVESVRVVQPASESIESETPVTSPADALAGLRAAVEARRQQHTQAPQIDIADLAAQTVRDSADYMNLSHEQQPSFIRDATIRAQQLAEAYEAFENNTLLPSQMRDLEISASGEGTTNDLALFTALSSRNAPPEEVGQTLGALAATQVASRIELSSTPQEYVAAHPEIGGQFTEAARTQDPFAEFEQAAALPRSENEEAALSRLPMQFRATGRAILEAYDRFRSAHQTSNRDNPGSSFEPPASELERIPQEYRTIVRDLCSLPPETVDLHIVDQNGPTTELYRTQNLESMRDQIRAQVSSAPLEVQQAADLLFNAVHNPSALTEAQNAQMMSVPPSVFEAISSAIERGENGITEIVRGGQDIVSHQNDASGVAAIRAVQTESEEVRYQPLDEHGDPLLFGVTLNLSSSPSESTVNAIHSAAQQILDNPASAANWEALAQGNHRVPGLDVLISQAFESGDARLQGSQQRTQFMRVAGALDLIATSYFGHSIAGGVPPGDFNLPEEYNRPLEGNRALEYLSLLRQSNDLFANQAYNRVLFDAALSIIDARPQLQELTLTPDLGITTQNEHFDQATTTNFNDEAATRLVVQGSHTQPSFDASPQEYVAHPEIGRQFAAAQAREQHITDLASQLLRDFVAMSSVSQNVLPLNSSSLSNARYVYELSLGGDELHEAARNAARDMTRARELLEAQRIQDANHDQNIPFGTEVYREQDDHPDITPERAAIRIAYRERTGLDLTEPTRQSGAPETRQAIRPPEPIVAPQRAVLSPENLRILTAFEDGSNIRFTPPEEVEVSHCIRHLVYQRQINEPSYELPPTTRPEERQAELARYIDAARREIANGWRYDVRDRIAEAGAVKEVRIARQLGITIPQESERLTRAVWSELNAVLIRDSSILTPQQVSRDAQSMIEFARTLQNSINRVLAESSSLRDSITSQYANLLANGLSTALTDPLISDLERSVEINRIQRNIEHTVAWASGAYEAQTQNRPADPRVPAQRFEYLRLNLNNARDLANFAELGRRAVLPSASEITIRESSPPSEAETSRVVSSMQTAFNSFRSGDEFTRAQSAQVLTALVNSLPDSWISNSGWSRDQLIRAAATGGERFVARLNHRILLDNGIFVMYDHRGAGGNGRIGIYRATHTIESRGLEGIRTAIIENVPGEPSLIMDGAGGHFDPAAGIIVLRTSELDGQLGVSAHGHEVQHLVDFAAAFGNMAHALGSSRSSYNGTRPVRDDYLFNSWNAMRQVTDARTGNSSSVDAAIRSARAEIARTPIANLNQAALEAFDEAVNSSRALAPQQRAEYVAGRMQAFLSEAERTRFTESTAIAREHRILLEEGRSVQDVRRRIERVANGKAPWNLGATDVLHAFDAAVTEAKRQGLGTRETRNLIQRGMDAFIDSRYAEVTGLTYNELYPPHTTNISLDDLPNILAGRRPAQNLDGGTMVNFGKEAGLRMAQALRAEPRDLRPPAPAEPPPQLIVPESARPNSRPIDLGLEDYLSQFPIVTRERMINGLTQALLAQVTPAGAALAPPHPTLAQDPLFRRGIAAIREASSVSPERMRYAAESFARAIVDLSGNLTSNLVERDAQSLTARIGIVARGPPFEDRLDQSFPKSNETQNRRAIARTLHGLVYSPLRVEDMPHEYQQAVIDLRTYQRTLGHRARLTEASRANDMATRILERVNTLEPQIYPSNPARNEPLGVAPLPVASVPAREFAAQFESELATAQEFAARAARDSGRPRTPQEQRDVILGAIRSTTETLIATHPENAIEYQREAAIQEARALGNRGEVAAIRAGEGTTRQGRRPLIPSPPVANSQEEFGTRQTNSVAHNTDVTGRDSGSRLVEPTSDEDSRTNGPVSGSNIRPASLLGNDTERINQIASALASPETATPTRALHDEILHISDAAQRVERINSPEFHDQAVRALGSENAANSFVELLIRANNQPVFADSFYLLTHETNPVLRTRLLDAILDYEQTRGSTVPASTSIDETANRLVRYPASVANAYRDALESAGTISLAIFTASWGLDSTNLEAASRAGDLNSIRRELRAQSYSLNAELIACAGDGNNTTLQSGLAQIPQVQRNVLISDYNSAGTAEVANQIHATPELATELDHAIQSLTTGSFDNLIPVLEHNGISDPDQIRNLRRSYISAGTARALANLDGITEAACATYELSGLTRFITNQGIDFTPPSIADRALSATRTLADLISIGSLEQNIHNISGLENSTISRVSYRSGLAGAFAIDVQVPQIDGSQTSRRIFLKSGDLSAARFGEQLLRAEGILTSRHYDGLSYQTGRTYVNGRPEVVEYGLIEDIHDLVGTSQTVRLPDGRIETVTVRSIAMLADEALYPERILQDTNNRAYGATQAIYESLRTEDGRIGLFESWDSYHEGSRNALLMDRAPRNSVGALVELPDGSTQLIFGAIDTDAITERIEPIQSPEGAHVGNNFAPFDRDFTNVTNEFVQSLSLASAGYNTLFSNPADQLSVSALDIAHSLATVANSHPAPTTYTPEMLALRAAAIHNHDGGSVGLNFDSSLHGVIAYGHGYAPRPIRSDGRTQFYEDEFNTLHSQRTSTQGQADYQRTRVDAADYAQFTAVLRDLAQSVTPIHDDFVRVANNLFGEGSVHPNVGYGVNNPSDTYTAFGYELMVQRHLTPEQIHSSIEEYVARGVVTREEADALPNTFESIVHLALLYSIATDAITPEQAHNFTTVTDWLNQETGLNLYDPNVRDTRAASTTVSEPRSNPTRVLDESEPATQRAIPRNSQVSTHTESETVEELPNSLLEDVALDEPNPRSRRAILEERFQNLPAPSVDNVLRLANEWINLSGVDFNDPRWINVDTQLSMLASMYEADGRRDVNEVVNSALSQIAPDEASRFRLVLRGMHFVSRSGIPTPVLMPEVLRSGLNNEMLPPKSEINLTARQLVFPRGTSENLNAQGVEEDKGGFDNLASIIIGGEIIAGHTGWLMSSQTGRRSFGDPSANYAGHHGPYYIVVDGFPREASDITPISESHHQAYVVPSEAVRDNLSLVLAHAVSNGMMTREEAVIALSKVVTYDEFGAAPRFAFGGQDVTHPHGASDLPETEQQQLDSWRESRRIRADQLFDRATARYDSLNVPRIPGAPLTSPQTPLERATAEARQIFTTLASRTGHVASEPEILAFATRRVERESIIGMPEQQLLRHVMQVHPDVAYRGTVGHDDSGPYVEFEPRGGASGLDPSGNYMSYQPMRGPGMHAIRVPAYPQGSDVSPEIYYSRAIRQALFEQNNSFEAVAEALNQALASRGPAPSESNFPNAEAFRRASNEYEQTAINATYLHSALYGRIGINLGSRGARLAESTANVGPTPRSPLVYYTMAHEVQARIQSGESEVNAILAVARETAPEGSAVIITPTSARIHSQLDYDLQYDRVSYRANQPDADPELIRAFREFQETYGGVGLDDHGRIRYNDQNMAVPIETQERYIQQVLQRFSGDYLPPEFRESYANSNHPVVTIENEQFMAIIALDLGRRASDLGAFIINNSNHIFIPSRSTSLDRFMMLSSHEAHHAASQITGGGDTSRFWTVRDSNGTTIQIEFNRNFNEAMTDYLGRRMSIDLGYSGENNAYPGGVAAMHYIREILADHFASDQSLSITQARAQADLAMTRMYFSGNLEQVSQIVDSRLGEGTFSILAGHGEIDGTSLRSDGSMIAFLSRRMMNPLPNPDGSPRLPFDVQMAAREGGGLLSSCTLLIDPRIIQENPQAFPPPSIEFYNSNSSFVSDALNQWLRPVLTSNPQLAEQIRTHSQYLQMAIYGLLDPHSSVTLSNGQTIPASTYTDRVADLVNLIGRSGLLPGRTVDSTNLSPIMATLVIANRISEELNSTR